jgi:hypothetical protein
MSLAGPVACVLVFGPAVAGAQCEPPAMCTEKAALVDADGWSFVAPDADPLWPAPDDAVPCGESDIQVASFGADEAVEVDTRFGCGWATVTQPLRSSLAAGDQVQIRIFYFAQSTFPQSVANVAVALDDTLIVDEYVDVPAASGLIAPVVVLDRAVDAGAPARFHVGNHGDNSWNLIELSRVFATPCADDPSVP